MPIPTGCTHCGSDQHNTTECPMMLAEREAFEHMVRFIGASAPFHYIRDALPKDDPRYGQYMDESLQSMWVGWQARAKLPISMAAQDDKRLRVALSYADHPFREDAVRCPADTKDELYNALTVIAAAYRHAIAAPAVKPVHPDRDQIALDAASDIMALVYGPMPAGGSVQLQAQVQCRILDAINGAQQPVEQQAEKKPVPAFRRQPLSMDDETRERLTLIAREAAISSTHRYSYMPVVPEAAQNWQPHAWALEAMRMVELAAAPPAAQDVEGLMEALEEISRSETAVGDIARSALAAHRAQQGGE